MKSSFQTGVVSFAVAVWMRRENACRHIGMPCILSCDVVSTMHVDI